MHLESLTWLRRRFRNVRTSLGALVVTCLLGLNCSKPKTLQYYSRTPEDIKAAKNLPQGRPLRVGVSVDVPRPVRPVRANDVAFDPMIAEGAAYQEARATTQTFLAHALQSGKFQSVDWVRPETMEQLDCQVELSVTLDSSPGPGVRYCLGRITANIYNRDHSILFDRVSLFHEAMYTPKGSNQLHIAHDGSNVHEVVQTALFDQLIRYLAGVPYSN